MRTPHHDTQSTLTDHIAIAFLNALLAFPTGLLLWLALNGAPVTWAGWLPFQAVFWFTAGVIAVGVVVRDTWLANLYGWIWHILFQWFSRP